ncbi:hypothetical protein FACS1894185_0860 [Betaproteobacteria bacterium]|nr:hypothetical protein FACS1894185_0860 [Betaproteobacteria bacterium]
MKSAKKIILSATFSILLASAAASARADDASESLQTLEKLLTCQQYGEAKEILPLLQRFGAEAKGESPFGSIHVFPTAPEILGQSALYVVVDDSVNNAALLYTYLATGSENALAQTLGAKKNEDGEFAKRTDGRELLIVKDTEKYAEKPAQAAVILACDMNVNPEPAKE